jgi:hypothetical protein
MRLASVLTVAALAFVPAVASAQDLGTGREQDIEITIQATDVFTINTPGPVSLSVPATNTATLFSNAGGTYAGSSNAVSSDTRNITAQVDANTTGLTIEVQLTYTGTNGTGGSFITLGTSALPAVTGIYASTFSGNISYRLTAAPTVTATGGSPLAKTVTFTLVDAVP